MNLRLGLCCQFVDAPIKFRTTTVKACSSLAAKDRFVKLSALCLSNAHALLEAYHHCLALGIPCFRINSQILPCKTHPEVGYRIQELPDADKIVGLFQECGEYARTHQLRASFHPDQFVVLSSPREDVVDKSLEELEYQAEVAEWVGADVVNIHGGGGYGDKPAALDRFARSLDRVSSRVRERLTVENDDRTYSPEELLPLCQKEGIPLVYDVHHHRCLPDSLDIATATQEAMATWNREPMFHISSPKEGWDGKQPQKHHDYIDFLDFPHEWLDQEITIEVEARAKERAVLKLQAELRSPINRA